MKQILIGNAFTNLTDEEDIELVKKYTNKCFADKKVI